MLFRELSDNFLLCAQQASSSHERLRKYSEKVQDALSS